MEEIADMARNLKVEYPGTIYHVAGRIITD